MFFLQLGKYSSRLRYYKLNHLLGKKRLSGKLVHFCIEKAGVIKTFRDCQW